MVLLITVIIFQYNSAKLELCKETELSGYGVRDVRRENLSRLWNMAIMNVIAAMSNTPLLRYPTYMMKRN